MFLILFLCFIMFLTLYDAKNERESSKWLIFADFWPFGACKEGSMGSGSTFWDEFSKLL